MTQIGFRLKYLQKRKDKFLYRRRIPTDIIHLYRKKFYHKQLPCSVRASDAEITLAWSEVNSNFESILNTSRNTFSAEVEEEKIKREALKYLRFHKLEAGVLKEVFDTYVAAPWDAHPTAFTVLEDRYSKQQEYDYNTGTSFDDFEITNPATYQEKVAHKAWELAISNVGKVKPKTLLSECWDIYNQNREEGRYDKNNREGRRVYASWERLLSYIDGDCLIEDSDTIYEAVDKMIADRAKVVSPASIERDWIVISAVLSKVIKVDRLNLKFHKPIIKKHNKKVRPTFSQTDQIEIVTDIVSGKYQTNRGVLMLLALQGGIINSELQRLKTENVRLNTNIPYIVITDKTKTKDRKRTVPVTVGVSWLRRAFEELADGSEYAMGREFASAKDSTISKRIVLSLGKYRVRDKKKYSCYSFRHSYKANVISHNAPERYRYIAGWVNKEAVISDTYAQDAMTQEAVLGGLQEVSKVVNKHLLSIESIRLVKTNDLEEN